MLKSGEEILAELDSTLDQLLLNAQTIHHISIYSLCENEMKAMQKTQESLLARFLHTNELLDEEQRKALSEKKASDYEVLQNKLKRFGKLNASFIESLSNQFGIKSSSEKNKKPRIGRNRKSLKMG